MLTRQVQEKARKENIGWRDRGCGGCVGHNNYYNSQIFKAIKKLESSIHNNYDHYKENTHVNSFLCLI